MDSSFPAAVRTAFGAAVLLALVAAALEALRSHQQDSPPLLSPPQPTSQVPTSQVSLPIYHNAVAGETDFWDAITTELGSLDALLGKGGTQQLAAAWGKTAFQVKGRNETKEAWSLRFGGLFGMQSFYQMMYTQSFERRYPGRDGFADDVFRADARNIATYRNGFDIMNMKSRNNNFASYLAGSTLVENHADKDSTALNRLACWITAQSNISTNTNIYLTGPGTQGFSLHTDFQDTLILQTEGSKVWKVFSEPPDVHMPFKPNCIRDDPKYPGDKVASWQDALQRHGLPRDAPVEQLLGPPSTHVLEAGDVLYIPRGTPHYALTHEHVGSLHITVTLNTQTHSIHALLADAIEHVGSSYSGKIAKSAQGLQDNRACRQRMALGLHLSMFAI
jgi:hypothetical protein